MARILIVEDDENITKMIEAALSIVGHTYVSCADGGTAVDMILYGSYDLVLLDIMLPGADGFSVMEQVRPQGDAGHFPDGPAGRIRQGQGPAAGSGGLHRQAL